MKTDTLFDKMKSWTYYTIFSEGVPIDCIKFWTTTSDIEVDWQFRRSKSLVYREDMKDSAPFYSKDANFIIHLDRFKRLYGEKYIKL